MVHVNVVIRQLGRKIMSPLASVLELTCVHDIDVTWDSSATGDHA
jgi:hypothetical protein